MNPPPPPTVLVPPLSNGTMVVSNPQYVTATQERKRPGETYITVLPGHTKPVFVRDRKKPIGFGLGCGLSAIIDALVPIPIRRSYSAGPIRREVRITSAPVQHTGLATEQPAMTYPSQPLSAPHETYHNYGGQPLTAEVMRRSGHTDEIVLQHTCSSCGKFRSPNYHSRHPLAPGELPRPGVCRKCVKEHTSSDDSDEQKSRHRRSRRHEKSRRKKNRKRGRAKHSDSTKDSSSSKDEVRIIRRSYSTGGGPRSRRRSESRSSPSRQPRISIIYEPRERNTRRSSGDGVRNVETTDQFERRRRSRPRSRSQDSSGDLVQTVRYLERLGQGSGARITETRNHFEGRSRRRSRSRSRSRDSFGDLVETVRYPNRSRRSISRSSSRSPPQHLIRRVRYVDEPRRSCSRSRSRSSSRHRTMRYERSEEHRVEEDHPVRSDKVVMRRNPPLLSHIDYGEYQGPLERVIRRRPSILRRSESLDRTTHPVHRRGYLDHSSGTYPPHVHEDRHYAERSYDYEPQVDPWSRPASQSVQVVRMSSDNRGSEEHLAPRVRFVRPPSPRRPSVVERTVVETSEPIQRRRRRRFRVVDEDLLHESSEDYSLPEHFRPPRRYRATQVPPVLAPPPRFLNRNSSVAAHDDEQDITRMLESTQIAPQPVLSPFRGRTPSREREYYRSRSSHRRPPLYKRATDGGVEHNSARYTESSEDRVLYPEPERRQRLMPPPAAPLPWNGQRWRSGQLRGDL